MAWKESKLPRITSGLALRWKSCGALQESETYRRTTKGSLLETDCAEAGLSNPQSRRKDARYFMFDSPLVRLTCGARIECGTI
jgi:hypothetical protein